MIEAKTQEVTPADERVANAERTLHEVEERFDRELKAFARQVDAERRSSHTYIKVWLKRHGAPWWRFWRRRPALRVSQDELRAAASECSRLTFEVQPDGETLRISEVTDEAAP